MPKGTYLKLYKIFVTLITKYDDTWPRGDKYKRTTVAEMGT